MTQPRSRFQSLPFPAQPELGAWYTNAECDAAIDAIRASMNWRTGFTGPELGEFERRFSEFIGVRYAIAINGAGTGIDMALRCLDVQPGDEVISSAINFPGTHLAIVDRGARLVLCEADPVTLNLDPEDIEHRITDRTRAIVVTHMNGLSADMPAITAVAERHQYRGECPPMVICDAARACGAIYRGERVGATGWITVFSFQRRKNMTTLGEGGMVVTNDPTAARRLRRLSSFGGGSDWGTNYKMTKVQAAVGLVQLDRLDRMNKHRSDLARRRSQYLRDRCPALQLPVHTEGHVYSYYSVLLPPELSGAHRDKVMDIMAEDYGVGSVVANPPSYYSNRLLREHTAGQDVPRSEDIGARLICPSFHPLMTEDDDQLVCDALLRAVAEVGSGRR